MLPKVGYNSIMDQTKKTHKKSHGSKEISADLEKLYSNPIDSTRSGALFNAFSYPTKISPEAIAIFIATHTSSGAHVLDTFGGSGTTGLAALLCDKPTEKMKQIVKNLGLKTQWGPRHATVYEIGTLGSFISQTMCNPVDPEGFKKAAQRMLDKVEADLTDVYFAKDPEGNKGVIRHVIWSDVLSCPKCQKENTYLESLVDTQPIKVRDNFICQKCGIGSPANFAKRVTEKYNDPILKRTITRKKRVPVIVYGQTGSKKWKRPVNSSDVRLISKVSKISIPKGAPIEALKWGDLYRAGYHLGISHLHHFYTSRNFLVLARLWEAIKQEPLEYQNALRLLILSYNSSHSTLMTRVVIKKRQKDFVLTGAQSGVLYISGLPVEKNIFLGVKRKVKTLSEAFALVHGSRSSVDVEQSSSVKLKLSDESVDYVFTDPPFGDYIPYAELNQINEIWIGKVTDRTQEIIVSNAQNRSVEEYGAMMKQVLGEISRTLKKNAKATIVFHSAKAEVWQALTDAYEFAGLGVKATSVLDKIQESFKQVVSTVAVKGDPLLLLEKRITRRRKLDEEKVREMIFKDVIAIASSEGKNLKEKSPERLYSRFITRCLQQGVPVNVDADTFYRRVRTE
jgi:16S rRNA G966 N2-methylase RsmD